MPRKVLIVDDSNYTQSVIKKAIQNHPDYEVIGVANDGASALTMARDLKPDLITLDNILPDMIGMNMIKVFKSDNAGVKIVMVSAIQQQSIIDQAISLGADSYLVKPITKENLLLALGQTQG